MRQKSDIELVKGKVSIHASVKDATEVTSLNIDNFVFQSTHL